MSRPIGRLPLAAKIRLAAKIWLDYAHVRVGLRRSGLPRFVQRLQETPRDQDVVALEPRRLSRAVHRTLRIGPIRPRCLTSSLVLLKLLKRQDTEADLVIGLPHAGDGVIAHAWVEVDGVVVGPPPGSVGQRELVRYGQSTSTGTRGSRPGPGPR